MEAQSIKLQVTADDVFKKRDVLMDTAYEALDDFVDDLLKYEEGGAEIGSNGVPSLPSVVDRFNSLAEFCQRVVVDEGLEAVEAMQEIGEDSQVVQRIKALQAQLRTTLEGLSKAVNDAESYFNTQHGHHETAREELRKAEERRSVNSQPSKYSTAHHTDTSQDFFYSVFGNDDIDRQIEHCANWERDIHATADAAWNMWDQLRSLNNNTQSLHNHALDQLLSHLSSIADKMRGNYDKIGEDRKIDRECWMAAMSLQYHVATNTVWTSRDDALRHVVKLVHTVNKTIDSDSDVVRLKEGIESKVREKLGAEKADELNGEKVFLTKPEDVDF
jgi:hypothetical protein